jgi:hypothetical protein
MLDAIGDVGRLAACLPVAPVGQDVAVFLDRLARITAWSALKASRVMP